MLGRLRSTVSLFAFLAVPIAFSPGADADEDALKKAVTFYASFDEAVKEIGRAHV